MNSRYETLALQARKLKLTELASANRETAGNMQDGIQPVAGKSEEALSVDLGDCGNSRTVATIARAHSLTGLSAAARIYWPREPVRQRAI